MIRSISTTVFAMQYYNATIHIITMLVLHKSKHRACNKQTMMTYKCTNKTKRFLLTDSLSIADFFTAISSFLISSSSCSMPCWSCELWMEHGQHHNHYYHQFGYICNPKLITTASSIITNNKLIKAFLHHLVSA